MRIACRGQIDHTDKADWRVCALLEFTVRLPTFAAFRALRNAQTAVRRVRSPNDAAIGPRVILLSTQKAFWKKLLHNCRISCLRFIEKN